MRIDSSGNVGIGVTPESWNVYDQVFEIGNASVFTYSADELNISANSYYNSGHLYKNTGEASRYQAVNGTHIFYVAPSGTADNALSWTTAMIISNEGTTTCTAKSGANAYAGHFKNSHASAHTVISSSEVTSGFTEANYLAGTRQSASSAWSNFRGYSGNGSTDYTDLEFNLRGDGNGYCDGSWSGGGADYAEYFEWADGNPLNDDRVGYSVALVNNQIKIAEAGDTVIGVISGSPSVVGDAAWNKWIGKYLKDDFGAYIFEEYSVTEWDEEVIDQEAYTETVEVEEVTEERQVTEAVETGSYVNLAGETVVETEERGVTTEGTETVVEIQEVDGVRKEVEVTKTVQVPVMETVVVTPASTETVEHPATYKTEHRSYHTDAIPADVTVPAGAVVTSQDGDGNNLQRRKPNPDYVEGQEYISREDRPEWDAVGLMGKLRIRKGQPTASTWIKMRDVSDSVEEWLVK